MMRAFKIRCFAALILPMAAAALLAGCSRGFDPDRVPKMKILIMDFDTRPGMEEAPRSIRGWWLAASTIYQNPRSGAMFAERLSAELSRLPYVNLFSRTDLKYYFLSKRQRLKEAFGNLGDSEIDRLMEETPDVDFARELGADKILAGEILEDYMDANRTIHWWHSKARIRCRLIDVLTGRVEWEKEYEEKEWFASQLAVQDAIADRAARDLKREYFRPLARSEIR